MEERAHTRACHGSVDTVCLRRRHRACKEALDSHVTRHSTVVTGNEA